MKTKIIMILLAVALNAAADDEWQMRIKMSDGSEKLFSVDSIASMTIGDMVDAPKPGEMGPDGKPLPMSITYRPWYRFRWFKGVVADREVQNWSSGPMVDRVVTLTDGTEIRHTLYDYSHPFEPFNSIAYSGWYGLGTISCQYNKDTYDDSFDGVHWDEKQYCRPAEFTQWCHDVDGPIQEVKNGEIPSWGIRVIMAKGDIETHAGGNCIEEVLKTSVGVDYLNSLHTETISEYGKGAVRYGLWNEYIPSELLINEDLNQNLPYFVETGSRGFSPGFFYTDMHDYNVCDVFLGNKDRRILLTSLHNGLWSHDQFLHIDDKIIDFVGLRPKVTKKLTRENVQSPTRGECVVFKSDQKVEFCGKIFHNLCVDTIYEIKYDEPVLRYLTPMTGDIGYVNGDTTYVGSGYDYYGSGEWRAQEFELSIVSSLRPIIDVKTPESVSVELIDEGEHPDYTNKTLPFHKWIIKVVVPPNKTGSPRACEFNLLDTKGNIIDTRSFEQERSNHL